MPIPPLKPKRARRRVTAGDVFRTSTLKHQMVETPRHDNGKVKLGQDRVLTTDAFERLSTQDLATLEAQAAAMNAARTAEDLAEAGSPDELTRARCAT